MGKGSNMSKTTYPGVDWSAGSPVNRDSETGIRYGVISCNSVCPHALEDVYANGEDMDMANYQSEARQKLRDALTDYFSDYKHGDEKKSKLDEAVDDAFDAVSDRLCDAYQNGDGCVRMRYDNEGYVMQTDSGGDLLVFRSPYFTYAQFCSPCAPGACHLSNPMEVESDTLSKDESDAALHERFGSNKCYCLGHDWFSKEDPCPYRMWSVESGKEVIQVTTHPDCQNCKGSGRDTVARIAKARQVSIFEARMSLKTDAVPRNVLDDDTFDCFRCDGKGKVEEATIQEKD